MKAVVSIREGTPDYLAMALGEYDLTNEVPGT
jgi:hypothetical protein